MSRSSISKRTPASILHPFDPLKIPFTYEALAALGEMFRECAVFATDADQNIVFWSTGAAELLGFTPEEAVGKNCLRVNRCHECMRECGVAKFKVVSGVPLRLFTADGSLITIEKRGRAFHDSDGTFLGTVEILAPVHEPGDDDIEFSAHEYETFHGVVTADPSMATVFQVVRNVGETNAPALVRGESGVGQELVARALHLESDRAEEAFVAVNCAALMPSLMESELFGHKKGAFTGATRDRKGLFEQAHRGTLFLDEVAELPLEMQAKLLRVLETGEVVPVGGSGAIKVDVRVVAATHRSLRTAVSDGKFREDLMYRLRVVPIFIPPLRERPGDIQVLVEHFVRTANQQSLRTIKDIAPETMRRLLNHDWPGNVRELKNVVSYAYAIGRGTVWLESELPPELIGVPKPKPVPSLSNSTVFDEKERIRMALEMSRGKVSKAAEILGISRPTLWRKRKKYGLF